MVEAREYGNPIKLAVEAYSSTTTLAVNFHAVLPSLPLRSRHLNPAGVRHNRQSEFKERFPVLTYLYPLLLIASIIISQNRATTRGNPSSDNL